MGRSMKEKERAGGAWRGWSRRSLGEGEGEGEVGTVIAVQFLRKECSRTSPFWVY